MLPENKKSKIKEELKEIYVNENIYLSDLEIDEATETLIQLAEILVGLHLDNN